MLRGCRDPLPDALIGGSWFADPDRDAAAVAPPDW
jgi:hypothetical protein